jgi:uncharacterized protein (DUF2252 family)
LRSLPWLACLFVAATLPACDDAPDDAREAEVASVVASADEPLIRARPALSAGKYVRMAGGAFEFYRGTLAVFRSDMRSGGTALAASRFDLELPLVPSIGDPHPENFSILRARDGSLALEPNDFDSADDAPYLWDVHRLAAGIAVAALVAGPDPSAAVRGIVRETLLGYRTGIERAARSEPAARVTASDNPVILDLFKRSAKDGASRKELTELTTLDPVTKVRKLRRGVLDPTDPQNVYGDLQPEALAALPAALERYRQTLIDAPAPEFFTISDAVRELGGGIASWPRVRAILAVRGPTDDPADDVLLEVKELADSGIAGLYAPGVAHDTVQDRVIRASRQAWARPDAEPLWGASEWLGFPVQVRTETEGQKGVKVAKLTGDLGTPDAITGLGRTLGELVARIHSSGPDGTMHAQEIYGRIGIDPDGFLDEQADVGVAYAELVLDDKDRFVRALRRLGLRLGIPLDPTDSPGPDLAALYGFPPAPPPLPPAK